MGHSSYFASTTTSTSTIRRNSRWVLLLLLLLLQRPAGAQQVVATIPTGTDPNSIAVDPIRNKTYVSNYNSGTVTVIDGATLTTTNVNVGTLPVAIAINPATNKIYNSIYYTSSVTVIDGATLSTTSIPVQNPGVMAVDQVTNKIYNLNSSSSTVTVIDGATLSTTVVPVEISPSGIAVNSVTNKIYVSCYTSNSVTIIDGTTLFTTTVNTSQGPEAVAVDETTNKIYVPTISGYVTVIDGATLATTNVAADGWAVAAAVNPITNKIYVANATGNSITVIDGATLSTVTIPAGRWPSVVAVNPVTNRTYVANFEGTTVTVVDGNNNAYVNLAVGNSPLPVGVNSTTNTIYVGNTEDGTVSVIDGAAPTALQFVPVTPCRVVDTRNADGEFGGPPIQAGTFRSFPIPDNPNCGIPDTAAAYSLNVTVVPEQILGYLTVWPTGQSQPVVSTMNSLDGRIKANAAIVPAGNGEAVSVYVTDTTNLILDIDGYFTPVSGSTLAFYALPPCRVADTRNPVGPLGGPYLSAGQERDFPILSAAACDIPSSAQAYSLNFTAIPKGGGLSYLTVWPQGQSKPLVSTLNDQTGTITANAALIAAGTEGGVATYPSDNTDLVIDINGYFAPAGSGGLSLYTVPPCRALDTRHSTGAFNGELNPPADVLDSPCDVWSTGQAYVMNATVVPPGQLGYLTLWADGQPRPLVSTLNAIDGAITSNMAIVPTINGSVDAYASGLTQLILDISGYFAP
jgi:YVTN family beta-propeller protein